jgi:plasmid maintenance system antidote protein VapI
LELKPSVPAAEAVNTLLENDPDMTLKQMAFDLHISESQASHLKTNRRNMQQDIAKQAFKVYDNFEFTLRLAHPFTDGTTSMVFDGPRWEDHRTTAKLNATREIMDVIKKFNVECLTTPPELMTAIQWESVEEIQREVVEARHFMDNFLIVLEKTFNLSVKQATLDLIPKWKSEGWLKK